MIMISDLPDDLESEILSRVPAKSLWELRGTCKRWDALFRDPKFVEKNKKLGKAVSVSMVLSRGEVYSIAGELQNNWVEPSIEFKLTSLKGSPKDLYLSDIFHCDGLILCSTSKITTLIVWNPCTGQKRNIKPKTCYRWEDRYALGYSTSSSDHSYKILRCCYYRNDQKVWVGECEIYEFCSDSWRVLDPFPLEHTSFFYDMCPMSLRGDTYFIAGDGKNGFLLIKFDFTTERFERLSLPFQSFEFVDSVALSVVRDEKLSVLHFGYDSKLTRIWVSNEDLSWRSDPLLEVNFDKFYFDLLVESFLLDEENKVALCCNVDLSSNDRKTRFFIVREDASKLVYSDSGKETRFNWPDVITYVPSLVRIH